MGVLDIFRRRAAIRDASGLAEFIDANAAFVAQKGIFEYSRARAGHYSKVLFKEPEFQAACDQARWRAFPLGLAMVAEVVEGVLCLHGGGEREVQVGAIRTQVMEVFDRYPPPAALGESAWMALRAALDLRLAHLALHPPKRAMDVPAPFADEYFGAMPIHEKLRGRDAATLHNYLRVTMCNIHDEFTKRADLLALAGALGAAAGPAAGPTAPRARSA